jgi:serine/threonine protein kinase/tetratricopeptide (TPR) repeat protein
MIGQTVSHYKILAKLGEGGMGVVYKAQDTKLKRTVALKFLPRDLMIDDQAKKRFYKEAQAAASIIHPYVCTIYEVEEFQSKTFIVMEYLTGQSLKEIIKAGPVGLDQTLKYAIQAAQGIQKAHEQGIIHRDIKSANIIITEEGTAKILDFGLAKFRKQTVTTKEGVIKGTIDYMSPEQTLGDKLDHRTDIWSLGVVIYEMLVGQLPFRAAYEQAIMYSIMNEEPEPITALRTGVPMELERIVNKAISKDSNERYQHLDDLIVDMERVKKLPSPKPSSPKKTGIFKALDRLVKPIRVPVIFLVMAFMVIGGYLIFKGIQKDTIPGSTAPIQKRVKNKIVILPFNNLTGDKKYDNWKAGIQQCMIIDLYQSKYLNVLSSPVLIGVLSKLNLLKTQNYTDTDLKNIASQSEATDILQGTLTKAGDSIRINVAIQETNTLEIKNTVKVEGTGDASFHAMIDELTPKIKAMFDLSDQDIADDIDQNAAQISSTPEVLSYFNEGLKLWYERRFKESIKVLEKAVDIDPGFAFAYHQISMTYNYLGNYIQAKKYLEKALKLKDRASFRDRLLIQAWAYSFYRTSYKKRIKIYKELLKSYPDDEQVLIKISAVYRHLEEWDIATDYYRKVLEINPKSKLALWNLAYIYMAKGWYKKARDFLISKQYIFNNQNYFHRTIAHTYILEGKYERALEEIEKSRRIDPEDFNNKVLMGNIYHMKGNLILAENFYKEIIKKNDPTAKFSGHFHLANLYLIQGKYNRCEQEIIFGIEHSLKTGQKEDHLNLMIFLLYVNLKKGFLKKTINISNQIMKISGEKEFIALQKFALHFRGLAYIKMKNIEKAVETAQTLKQKIEKSESKKHMRLYYHLMGSIALENNQVIKAVDYLQKAISLLPSQVYGIINHSIFFESLASAYYKAGDLENAKRQYEKIISLTMGKLQWGDIYVNSYYWLGNIYQKRDLKEKSIENYKKFLQLWKNADPNIAELEEAKKMHTKIRKEIGD